MFKHFTMIAALAVAIGVGGIVISAKEAAKEPEKKEAKVSKQQDPEFTKAQAKSAGEFQATTLTLIDTVRPELYRYCHSLTGNPFDAEDLVQETLAKALMRLAQMHSGVEAPKRYLFRIATNAWIDEVRRNRPESLELKAEPTSKLKEEKPLEVGEAFIQLVQKLGPRERAIVVLREAFDLPLADIGAYLGITEGHARVLLHRSRKELAKAKADKAEGTNEVAPKELVDAFVAAFNKRDTKALVALMVPEGESDIIGVYGGVGPGVATGIFDHTFPDKKLLRAEAKTYRGEQIVVLWYKDGEEEVIRDIVRIEGSKAQATKFTFYFFCKDVLYAVAKELGAKAKDNDYHYPVG